MGRRKIKEAEEKVTQEDGRQAKARAAAEACARLLKERFGAREVYLFGSVAGDGPWHEHSDIDLAVEGLAPEQFFRAWAALDEVVPRGLWVDLVPLEDASPELRARILGEVKLPDDPLEALKGLIEDELRTLKRLVARMDELLAGRADPPTWIEMHAMASLIHGFYTGVESIFERIAVGLDGGLPKSAYWHLDLLNWMAEAREGVRPAVVDEGLWARLKEYLDFRHFFRHAYGYDLEWAKLRPLAEGMGEVLAELRRQVEAFEEALS